MKELVKNINNKLKLKKKNVSIAKNVVIHNCKVDKYANFAHDCEVVNSEIGLRTSVGRNTKIMDSKIGKYTSISYNVVIGAKSHRQDTVSTHSFTYRKKFGLVNKNYDFDTRKTYIGNDVWIGCGVIILSGVTIGDGAIIGAGAIVTKDVEPYSIVVGVPAKEIRKRFEKDIIDELLQLKWWDFDDEKIKENIHIFSEKLDENIIKKLKNINKDNKE